MKFLPGINRLKDEVLALPVVGAIEISMFSFVFDWLRFAIDFFLHITRFDVNQ
jgi:hypothetical protein